MSSRTKSLLPGASLVVGLSLLVSPALAKDTRHIELIQPSRPQVIRVEGPCPGPECDAAGLQPQAKGKRIVYLVFGGLTLKSVSSGTSESAALNQSWIINKHTATGSTKTVPAFQTSDLQSTNGLSRAQIIQGVIDQLYNSHAPYDVEFTTTRPTSGTYQMIVFGGSCGSVYGESGCAGIAMGDCGDYIPSNITFVFTRDLRVPGDLASTAAQESAHAYGLGHTDDNYDVMYPYVQTSIIPTSFGAGQVPDSSGCGLSYQDSNQRMLDTIGPRGQDTVKPMLTITAPQSGATVHAGDPISATATDASGIDFLEFRIGDDNVVDDTAPYGRTVLALAAGNYTISVYAHDNKGNKAFAQVSVYVSDGGEQSCTNTTDCMNGEECKNNICVPDNGLSGELGDTCMDNAECLSGICGTISDQSLCTQQCDDATPCPSGFECVSGGACWPSSGGGASDGATGGCAAAGPGSGSVPTLLVLVTALLLAWRRRTAAE